MNCITNEIQSKVYFIRISMTSHGIVIKLTKTLWTMLIHSSKYIYVIFYSELLICIPVKNKLIVNLYIFFFFPCYFKKSQYQTIFWFGKYFFLFCSDFPILDRFWKKNGMLIHQAESTNTHITLYFSSSRK